MQDMMKQYQNLTGFLRKTLPDDFDTVLFDLTEKGYPALEQTTWNDRELAQLRRLVAGTLKKGVPDNGQGMLNRLLVLGNTMIKVSVQFIFDADRPVLALCLLMDMSLPLKLSRFADSLLRVTGEDGEEISLQPAHGDEEQRTGELDDIPAIVSEFGTPPEEMTPSERKEVCCDLYDAGVFRLKGAIPQTAEALGISEQTVYRYISSIRKARS